MRIRKVRIAWSVFCGLSAVLLIVLWVRSYWWGEQVHYSTLLKTYYGIRSDCGYLIGLQGDFRPWRSTPGWLYTRAVPTRDWHSFTFKWNSKRRIFALPQWLVAILFATAAGCPWFRYRFSLRSLLIATTLVAVVLGLMAWTVR